jgi:hypothetical protein
MLRVMLLPSCLPENVTWALLCSFWAVTSRVLKEKKTGKNG